MYGKRREMKECYICPLWLQTHKDVAVYVKSSVLGAYMISSHNRPLVPTFMTIYKRKKPRLLVDKTFWLARLKK